jgi:hypothetical protein
MLRLLIAGLAWLAWCLPAAAHTEPIEPTRAKTHTNAQRQTLLGKTAASAARAASLNSAGFLSPKPRVAEAEATQAACTALGGSRKFSPTPSVPRRVPTWPRARSVA